MVIDDYQSITFLNELRKLGLSLYEVSEYRHWCEEKNYHVGIDTYSEWCNENQQ